ncbi:hypothetical protein [Lacipirellula limnantheis]|uniref:Uncharacterized protein n=1 Tax=Lacipirellula limnantheis TaxID=2528024 RepID=A0A517U1I1_9BACT|nr:hypothetical protein [Lacipirellula limnantheis]QDT74474.1 hypothetical protein I41_36710 [Lacipirellula limnantheis]
MATLLEGPCARMPYYTDIGVVYDAFGGRLNQFSWLVTGGQHTSYFGPDAIHSADGDATWLTGTQFDAFAKSVHRLVDWGVFSGFPSDAVLDVDNLQVYPYADGNPQFWVANPTIQHPQAEIEIVCFDTALVLLLCRDEALEWTFREHFPEAVDLVEYNRRHLEN